MGFTPTARYYASPLADAVYLRLRLGKASVDSRVTIHEFSAALAPFFPRYQRRMDRRDVPA